MNAQEKAVVNAAVALTEVTLTPFPGVQDPWWSHEHVWCHYCGQQVELDRPHDEGCPALALDEAVRALTEAKR